MSETVAPPPPQLSEEDLQKQLQVQVVDVSDAAAANAVDSAEEYLSRETTQRGVGGFLKRIWRGNIARDYYRQREIQRGRQEITESGNVFILQDGTQAEHNESMAAVVERFTSDYLHEGEDNRSLEAVEGGQELIDRLRNLVSTYARGDMDYEALVEERTHLLDQFGQQAHSQDRNRGLVYADNILEVASNARAAFEHGVGLEALDAAINGSVGEARTGVRTQARLEMTDRALDWMHRHHMSGVNETSLALGVAAAMTVAKLTARKLATAAGAFIGLGVGAGVIAAGREHLRVGQERAVHSRQMAEGAQIEADSSRRAEMEATRYETASASVLTEQMHALRQQLEDGDGGNLQELIALASAARARIHTSDVQGIDLLEYSSKTAVEAERLALDIELASSRLAIQNALEASDTELDLDALQQSVHEQIVQDIDTKDRVFNKLRRNRTLRMGLIGVASGMTIGLASQEGHALLDQGLRGVAEGPAGSDRQSLLSEIFRDDSTTDDQAELLRDYTRGGEALKSVAVDLPEGYDVVNARPGEMFGQDLVGPDGEVVISGLEWDQQGNLAKWVREDLREKGFELTQNSLEYNEPKVITESVTRSPGEYLQHHPNEFTRVHRELWFDNNTPGIYDRNELKLWWGGATGSGINSNGNYVFNVAHMSPDGSYHAGLSTNAQALINERQMRIALSMSQDTQQNVFMVPIDKNGNAYIDADSYIGRSLFENRDGRAHFMGAYAEAVQVMGMNPDGSENVRMLATVVGDNSPNSAADTVTRMTTERNSHYVTAIHPPAETPIEVPPVIPIYGRRGLEELRKPEAGGYGYYRSGEGYLGTGGERRRSVPFAPEVEGNPDAEIDANKSTERYLSSLRKGYMKTITKLSKDLEKQPKAEKPKAVIMIPAASHQEGKNIYHTLEQYSKQENVDTNDYEVVVLANAPNRDKKGRRVKLDKTVSEIERFQREHPEIRVRLLEKRLEKDEANIGWVRKALTDTVLTDLKTRGINLNEVLLISNDADSQWIDPNYIRTILDKAEANPGTDGFLGFIDWGYGAYKAHPETLAATRFMQMIEIFQRKRMGEVGSSGANFVFRPGAYTAVGGYRPSTPLGEDVELGRMIKAMRSGASTRRPIAFLGRSSEVNTSARRALEKLFKDGGAPVEQWSDEFSAFDELRTKEFDLRNFDFTDRAAIDRLVDRTENMLNQTLNAYRKHLASETAPTYRYGRLNILNHETMRNINRMLSVIGVKVHWNPDGTFNITNAARMIANLRRWQAVH